MDAEVHIDPGLTAKQRRILASGLLEWGGPAHCTNEIAFGMGFANVHDLFDTGDEIRTTLLNGDSLSRRDWARALVATEFVFASNVVGSGRDWVTTTGFSDHETIDELRLIQVSLTRETRPLFGEAIGTRPEQRS